MEPKDDARLDDAEEGVGIDWEWIALVALVALVAVGALVTGAIDDPGHHSVHCVDGLSIERAESWEPTPREVRELCEAR